MKYERTQKGNPHHLTVRQHVIALATIQRFAGSDGRVEVQLGASGPVKRLKPDADIFCMQRAWDQRSEHGYMKHAEDRFQPVADRIASGEFSEVPEGAVEDVNRFYTLWFHRSRVSPPGDPLTPVNGLTGHVLTRDEQERLEAAHVFFVRPGGMVATRHITGLQLQARLDHEGYSARSWGIVCASEGEFVMPDVPVHGLMPITPTILLAADQPSGFITKANLVQINTAFLAYTRRYFFGRNLKVALDGVTAALIQAAVIDRDKRIAAGQVV